MCNKIFISAIIFISVSTSFSQTKYNISCNNAPVSITATSVGIGLTKPMKTLPVNNLGSYFRVLMLFVEFQNDFSDPDALWPPNSLPPYANQLLAPQKQLGINAYQVYKLSDYFNKISRDQYDMIGDIVHVILPHDYDYYNANGGPGFHEAQLDVFRTLDSDPNFNWNRYDNWSWSDANQQYEMVPDGYIDMVFLQYRRQNIFGIGSGGFGGLLVDYTTSNGKIVDGRFINQYGSGVTGFNGSGLTRESVMGLYRHEFCHYTLGNHRPYSTISGGDGTRTICGSELGFSPEDMIAVGYDNNLYDPSFTSFNLGDLISTGDMLKIPTTTANEYFLVSNRRRLVGDGSGLTYDCNMIGDTAMGLPFKQFGDYSKGLYIYHVSNGNSYDDWTDLEAADGLWDWQDDGVTTPDWSEIQTLPVLVKIGVGHNDDNPFTDYFGDNARYLSRDGQSVISQANNLYSGWGQKWFSKGKRHTFLGEQGTDKIFTNNDNENWTSRELEGDRWDAWAIGYNQVFSPYSSPNTKNRNNVQTGIFIYYESLNGNSATVKVYTGAPGTPDETTALANTPPSRPMLYKPVEIYNCDGNYGYPKITWDNNLEPDMLRDGGFKRYKIYRAVSTIGSAAPLTYNFIGYYDDYTPNDTASFIDNNPSNGAFIYCANGNGVKANDTYYRYEIAAVDRDEWESNRSDFVSIKAHSIAGVSNKDQADENPKVFKLNQNYPNPFNPSTIIKYDLPLSTVVTIKVYNILGAEVSLLVNSEFKTAGSYSVMFDGSNLASGIYFYSLTAGSYTEKKKMVLIK